MKKILWLSRHPPIPSQLEELKRVFGEVEVDQDPNPFSSADEILRRFRRGRYDDMVVVAPLSVIGKLCELGVRPIWAEMEQVGPEEAEVEAAGRFYRFKRFRRVKRLTLEFEELQPLFGGSLCQTSTPRGSLRP